MGLFSKKPGGSFIGNLLRKGVNMASKGMLGNGEGVMGAEWDTDGDGKFSKEETANWKKNKASGVPQTVSATQPLSVNTQPIDLSQLVKLPSVNVGTDNKTNIILWAVVGILGIFVISKALK